MAEKRRALGRGLGALIPSAPPGAARPVDVFFPSGSDRPDDPSASGDLTASLPDPTDSADLAAVPGAVFAELPITSISPNPRQPRTVFDEDELAELVHSITEIGVLQPVVVRRSARGDDTGPAYELIMGERRLRASKIAGLTAIPAIIKDTQDDAMLRDALLENLHRSQLNPLEEAAAYRQLLDDFGCTQD
ncbi:MAG TPA: ParB/RepB/Spo0J family partition protein, partial [Dermatophilaceae bacterium]|nr:ParB/RepB/Spo0J family partition protein [Dermatophilaceae bacterium]